MLEWLIPFFAAFAAGVYIKREFKKRTDEIKKDLNEAVGGFRKELRLATQRDLNDAVGGFRKELRKVTQGARDSIAASIKEAKSSLAVSEVSTHLKEEKEKRAAEIQARADKELRLSERAYLASRDDELTDDEEQKNWGEIASMWADVWSFIKELRIEAIEGEKRGRAKGNLRQILLTSPNDLIVTLYNYGWFGDRASDLALEMLELYLGHRNRRVPVTRSTLERFRILYDEWNEIPD